MLSAMRFLWLSWGLWLGIILLCALIALWLSARPSNDREWSADQQLLPFIEINGDAARIQNIRNFTYRSTTDYDIHYDDRTYDLSKIDSLWYVVVPFQTGWGGAHTFLSFGFEGDEYLGISIEARKNKGESYSAFRGLFRQFEIMYVIADERDLIGLRANHRKNNVYLYPVRLPKEKIRALFVDMLNRASALREKPKFYNTATESCTTDVVWHLNKVLEKKLPYDIRVLLPNFSDGLFYEYGLIDTDLPSEKIRQHFKINDRAREYAEEEDFSVGIRRFEN